MGGPRLLNRRCLIVGGTGGIGLRAATRFAEEGAQVVVVGLAPGAPAGTFAGEGEGRITQELGDVSNESEVTRIFQSARETLGGRIDALLHVAGISGRRFGDGPLHECLDEGYDRVMNVNARGVFLTNREAVRIMHGQEPDAEGMRGAIVNIGSVLSESPSREFFGTIAYAASKGAIRSLTLAAAARYAPERIRFNLIEPGLIDTPMAARAVNDPMIRAYLAKKQPLAGGPGLPEDVAEAAVYLCGPEARFVTGAILNVDGGWTVSEGTS
jgi:NAD(P)-dependent dehydrogenase (short-subunit alcohol dehydrogenase family)